MTTQLYCLKCRQKKEVEAQEITTKNGKRALTAVCPTCQTKMFKFTKKVEPTPEQPQV